MYFKYWDNSNMRIREFHDVKVITNKEIFDPPFAIAGIGLETPAALMEDAVDRLAYLLCYDTETYNSRINCGNPQPVGERFGYDEYDGYVDALHLFNTREDAERAMDEITRAIARGDRIFDMTRYDRKTD